MIKLKFIWIIIGLLMPLGSLPAQYQWPYRDALQKDVRFWVRLFTEYHQNQYIFHDARDLAIIYRVVTYDSSISRSQRERKVRLAKKGLQKTLFQLAGKIERGDSLTAYEHYLRTIAGVPLSPADLRVLSRQVRVQQGMVEPFAEGLRRAQLYLPYIRQLFREEGLPEELSFLPHIESSFNPRARSHVGAAGLWQFMRRTARRYMKVNRVIDQRYDVFVSSRAAARLLRYNFRQTGDWALAITAYNFGLAGIQRANKHHLNYLRIRENYRHRRFGFASRNFYPEFLAVVQILRHVHRYFPNLPPARKPSFIRYQLKRSVRLPALARRLKLPLRELKELNPVYTRRVWKGWRAVPAGYWLNLPAGGFDYNQAGRYVRLEQNWDLVATETPAQAPELPVDSPERPFSHLPLTESFRVLADRTTVLSRTASPRHFQSTVSGNPPRDETKKRIVIDEDLKRLLAAELEKRLRPSGGRTGVFINETWSHFAEWLNVPQWRLRRENGTKRNGKLRFNQMIKLDFSRVDPQEFVKRRLNYHLMLINKFLNKKQFVNIIEYEVNSGESVWKLANRRYYVPMELIAYFNSQKDLSRIKKGDILKIPLIQFNHLTEETL